MSSVNSTQYAKQIADPAVAGYGGQICGDLANYESLVTIGSSYSAANDTANLFITPAGYRPVANLWHVESEALGTTATVHIGTAADADAIAASLNLASAASTDASGGVQWLAPVTTTATTTWIATLATAASLTAGKTFVVKAVFAKM